MQASDDLTDEFRDLAGFGLFHATTDRDMSNWWHMAEVGRESWRRRAEGNLDFIPSEVQVRPQPGTNAVQVREIPPPEVMPRLATDEEIPSSAKSCRKKLVANGWTVRVEYGKHSWPKQADKVEDESGEVIEKIPYGIIESIVVKARRGDVRMFAIWMTKPWTKDGDAFKFFTAHFVPSPGKVKSTEMNKLIGSPSVIDQLEKEGGEAHDGEEAGGSASDPGDGREQPAD